LAGDAVLIVGVIDFLATAVLIKPVLLLMSIPMARQLRCWRQSGDSSWPLEVVSFRK
jgi:hypothetical protein